MESKVSSPEQIVESSDRTRRGLLWGVLIVVIVGIVGINIWSLLRRHQSSDLVAHERVPDFSLISQHGTPLALSDLQGKIWVADFIFTRCVAACPIMTGKMQKLQDEFKSADVYFVSFSVDPEYDTSEVLSRYADSYGVNANKWFFLTGKKETIYHLTQKGFNLAVGRQSTEILHSSRFVLVDRQGQIRGYYDSNEKNALHKLRRDIKMLLGKRKLLKK